MPPLAAPPRTAAPPMRTPSASPPPLRCDVTNLRHGCDDLQALLQRPDGIFARVSIVLGSTAEGGLARQLPVSACRDRHNSTTPRWCDPPFPQPRHRPTTDLGAIHVHA